VDRGLKIPALRAAVVAAVIRWLFCFWLFPSFLARESTVGAHYYFDSYREIAASVVSGNGYRLGPHGPAALHRPPAYVALVALCRPGDPARCYLLVQFLHGILGALAAYLTIRAALAWGIGSRDALFGGWLVALWPFAIWETKVTVPETLLSALVAAAALALALVNATRGPRIALLLGGLAALLALTHPIYQVALLPFAGSILAGTAPRARKLASLAAMILAFSLPVGLWLLRNHRAGYDGLATGFGYHYFRGVYGFDRLLRGEPYFRDNDAPARAFIDGILREGGFAGVDWGIGLSDPVIQRYLDGRAREHARLHPGYDLAKTVVKTPLAWVQEKSAAWSAANAVLVLPLFALAAVAVRRRARLWIPALVLLSINAAMAFVAVEAIPMRYALPLVPLLAILAGGGLEETARTRGA
jgi:hypothetical protein